MIYMKLLPNLLMKQYLSAAKPYARDSPMAPRIRVAECGVSGAYEVDKF
jgi:hypothetical protein